MNIQCQLVINNTALFFNNQTVFAASTLAGTVKVNLINCLHLVKLALTSYSPSHDCLLVIHVVITC